MKKIIFLFLLLPTLSFSQETELSDDCDFTAFVIKPLNDNTYKTHVTNFDSLQSGETCFLSWMNTASGKPDGILFVYDENGKKRRKSIYRAGSRVGTHLTWYATGELEDETTWETDLYFTSKSYYKSGKIKYTAENGNRTNAVYKSFYQNGQLASVYDWSKDGDKEWYQNGIPKLERNTKTNVYKEWYENGKVKMEGKLVRGWTRIGEWSYYNDKGKLVRTLFYEDNNSNTSYFGDEAGFTKEKKY